MTRTQQVFVTSRTREVGSPQDLTVTFSNESFTRGPRFQEAYLQLAEFNIVRNWFDVQANVNDRFSVLNTFTNVTTNIVIPPGNYTLGAASFSNGQSLPNTLQNLLTSRLGSGWSVSTSNVLTGQLVITTPGTSASGNTFQLIFSSSTRTGDLLGFGNSLALSNTIYSSSPASSGNNETLTAPNPPNLMRTKQLVMHTDLNLELATDVLSNYGNTISSVTTSDILATIPVTVPRDCLVVYQSCQTSVNRVRLRDCNVRTMRVYFTDDTLQPMNLNGCEWTAIFLLTFV